MLETLSRLFERAIALAQRAYEAGWISSTALRNLHHVEHRTPADLFVQRSERPLVVALFGGTGVGKSSLLNRLAGAPLARTGAERPTSREVTVYVHEGIALAALPEEMPLREVQIARHANARQRDVLWIDCPDIDSTVTSNRELALSWLSHVDLVLYVVSPERYRDDAGWRVLVQRGGRHGWAFVVNRSDEGAPEQKDDFARLLRESGFEAPQVFMTSCRSGGAFADEFEALVGLIHGLVREHAVHELERRGLRARLMELRETLRLVFAPLGTDADWQALAATWEQRWKPLRESLTGSAALSVHGVVERMVRNSAAPPSVWSLFAPQKQEERTGNKQTASRMESDHSTITVESLRTGVWDGWARDRFVAALDILEVDATQRNLASVPLRRRIDEIGALADDVVSESLARSAAEAAGDAARDARAILRSVCGGLCYFLPACAALWAGYVVVQRYYIATTTTQPIAFLGTDFAVHTAILVLLAWGAPFAGYVSLWSDPRGRIKQALLRAYGGALDRLGYATRSVITETSSGAAEVRAELDRLFEEIDGCIKTGVSGGSLVGKLVLPDRMIS